MSNFIDGYAFPIAKKDLDKYNTVAERIAEIWKKHGALSYSEFILDVAHLEGTKSFKNIISNSDETVIFGWVEFTSKESRNLIHGLISQDKEMEELVAPLLDPNKKIFNSELMLYGGFKSFIKK